MRNMGIKCFLTLLFFLALYAVLPGRKPGNELFFLDLSVQSSEKVHIQIFYDLGRGFSEQNTRDLMIPGGKEHYPLRFQLPERSGKKVRLDFDGEGEINLQSLTLLNVFKDRRLPVTVSSTHDVEIRGSENKKNLTFSLTGEDPQLILSLPHGVNFFSWLRLVVLFTLAGCCYLFWDAFSFLQRESGREHRLEFKVGRGLLAIIVAVVITVVWLRTGAEAEHNEIIVPERVQSDRIAVPDFPQGQVVPLQRPDGLFIKGIVYTPEEGKGPWRAVLLLHGNYPQGQAFPLYRVLAQFLARQGFLVMTIDMAGFGGSGDPFAAESPVDITLIPETMSAIDYLGRRKDIAPGGLGIIGHSMGADPALMAGLSRKEISSIILIGPPRRVQERYHNPADIDLFWQWAHTVVRERYGRTQFPQWFSKEVWVKEVLRRDMVYMLPQLQHPGHKPVLFIDGGKEPLEDRHFLEDYVQRCASPVSLLTLPKAGHNCNVWRRGDGRIMYDSGVMELLIAEIRQWLLNPPETGGQRQAEGGKFPTVFR